MAIVSVLIGGIVGFGSFLSALFIYNFTFLWSLTIYSATGIATTLALITVLMIAQALYQPTRRQAKIQRRSNIHKQLQS